MINFFKKKSVKRSLLQKLYKLFFFFFQEREKKPTLQTFLFYFIEFQSITSASEVELLDIMFTICLHDTFFKGDINRVDNN